MKSSAPTPLPHEPKLAPPGAGIPLHQRIVLHLFVKPLIASRAPWEESQESFLKITRKIRRELEGLSQEQIETKVLVPPMTGLEDSSRYWSIAMTLEHLVIVGSQLMPLVQALSAGSVPDAKADIAALKPSGKPTTQEILENFRKFCDDDFPALLPSLKNRRSPLQFRHPWFGKMNAQAWYWLLGAHQGIHLRQIRAIKKGL
jgi:hypothetical protein